MFFTLLDPVTLGDPAFHDGDGECNPAFCKSGDSSFPGSKMMMMGRAGSSFNLGCCAYTGIGVEWFCAFTYSNSY